MNLRKYDGLMHFSNNEVSPLDPAVSEIEKKNTTNVYTKKNVNI